jgi:endonuclease YncB( thermonuclease family)
MAGGGHHAAPALSFPSRCFHLPDLRTCLVCLSLWAAALLVPAAGAYAAELHGRVVGVSDGDTLTVVDAARALHKVRLAGIDAPEKKQPYGVEARRHLAALVFGKAVVVSWHKRDRYGRLVGRVGLAVPGACGRPDCPRVEDVGLAQVESGLAWHYRQYQNEQSPEDRRRYALAEQEARAKREGLWRDAHPMPPWEYRGSSRAALAGAVTR